MRIALVSPFPPLTTGIADYSAELLPHLAERTEVAVFVENPDQVADRLRREYEFLDAARLPGMLARGEVDLPVYQMGNSLFHRFQLDLIRRCPGILVLHDLVLHHLLANLTLASGDLEGYRRLLIEEYGSVASDWPERIAVSRPQGSARYNLYCRLPLSGRIVSRSLGVVCHSSYVERRLRRWLPDHPIRVIPQLAEMPNADRKAARARLRLHRGEFVIGILGGLAENRLYPVAFAACARLAERSVRVRVVVWGTATGEVTRLLDELQLSGRTTFVGRTSHSRFLSDVAALDAGIALRFPTVGETSGSVIRMMSLGVPIVTTDVDGFRETPDACCARVVAGRGALESITDALHTWATDPVARKACGEAGARFAHRHHSPASCAQQLLEFAAERYEQTRGTRSAMQGRARDQTAPSVAAVLILDGREACVESCIAPLLDQDYAELELIVVDLAGSAETAATVAKQHPSIHYVKSATSTRMASLASVLQTTNATYVAVLATNARPHVRWIRELVAAAEANPKAAVVGGRFLMAGRPTVIQSTGLEINEAGFVIDRQMGQRDRVYDALNHEVLAVRTEAVLMRAAAVRESWKPADCSRSDRLAGIELCLQLRSSGWSVWYVPGAVAWLEPETVCLDDSERTQLRRHIADAKRDVVRDFVQDGTVELRPATDLAEIHDRDSARARQSIVMGENDTDCLGPGWFSREQDAVGRWYRWCQGRAWFYLRLQEATRTIVVEASSPIPTALELLGDDLEIGVCTIQGSRTHYQFQLPEALRFAHTLELCLCVPTFRPSEVARVSDERDLGVQVFEIHAVADRIGVKGLVRRVRGVLRTIHVRSRRNRPAQEPRRR